MKTYSPNIHAEVDGARIPALEFGVWVNSSHSLTAALKNGSSKKNSTPVFWAPLQASSIASLYS
jgi:hypothetical protein